MEETFHYGGQAIMEGVMMRGKRLVAMAVRTPEGEIRLRTEPLNAAVYGSPVARVPVLRGITMLWDTLVLGTQALLWSAEVAAGDEVEEGSLQGAAGWGIALVGVTLGILLFMALPPLLVGLLPLTFSSVMSNLLEGAVRVALIVGYMALVSRSREIRRVFAYHGAEHKTVNAYEAGAPLTVEGVRPFDTANPRCGTAFLLTLAVLSILVLAPLGRPPLLIRIATRILFVPLLAGLSYEFIRFSARHAQSPWLRWLIGPNIALQRLTTREPDGPMIEVAIRALAAVQQEEANGE